MAMVSWLWFIQTRPEKGKDLYIGLIYIPSCAILLYRNALYVKLFSPGI